MRAMIAARRLLAGTVVLIFSGCELFVQPHENERFYTNFVVWNASLSFIGECYFNDTREFATIGFIPNYVLGEQDETDLIENPFPYWLPLIWYQKISTRNGRNTLLAFNHDRRLMWFEPELILEGGVYWHYLTPFNAMNVDDFLEHAESPAATELEQAIAFYIQNTKSVHEKAMQATRSISAQ